MKNDEILEDVVLISGKPVPAEKMLSISDDTICIRFQLDPFTTSVSYPEIRIPDRIHGQPVRQKCLTCYRPSRTIKTPVRQVWRGRMQDPDDYDWIYKEETVEVSVYVRRLIVPDSIREIDDFSYGEVFTSEQWVNRPKEEAGTAPQPDYVIVGGVLKKYNGAQKDVAIPDGVEMIATEAFFGSKLESVDLPSSLKTIQPRAFHRCDHLKTVRYHGTPSQLRQIAISENGNDCLFSLEVDCAKEDL